jgi:hypothetical protein
MDRRSPLKNDFVFRTLRLMKKQRPQKKLPSEIGKTPLREIVMSEEDWEEFRRGVKLFNEGNFWHAHEAWELVWGRHEEDERLFFQGLIQLAAAYHHLVTKRQAAGARKNFEKAREKLEVFQPRYLGVHVKPLLSFIDEGMDEADGMDGAETLFSPRLVPKLQFQMPSNPDLLVELRELCTDERFAEGIRLFNAGYYWEAHETWEDIWRAAEGDAKTFVQAFVQAAAGFSFVKLAKAASAIYLFEKALEKFQQFEGVECPLGLGSLIASVRDALARVRAAPTNGSGQKAPPPRIELKG